MGDSDVESDDDSGYEHLRDLLSSLTYRASSDKRVSFPEGQRGKAEELMSFLYETDRSFPLLLDWLKHESWNRSVCLELVWLLHKTGAFPLSTYLYYNPNYNLYISEVLEKALFDHDYSAGEDIREVIIGILSELINYSSTHEPSVKSAIGNILHGLVEKVINHIYYENKLGFDYLEGLLLCPSIFEPLLLEFVLLHVQKMFESEVEAVTLTDIISHHAKKWNSSSLSPHYKNIIQKIVSALPGGVFSSEVNYAIQKKSSSWKFILSTISIFILISDRNAELMKGLTEEWLKNSFQNKDIDLLAAALIVSRHCCAESVKHFTNYAVWFGSLQLKSTVSFTFFFEYLTQLVPYERPLYLKIHINKVPSAPQSCQNLLSDYILLTKTRLADLGESTECIGIFNDFYETDEEGQSSDIARVVTYFTEHGEIPKVVMEASVFRRNYYEKTFLHSLLSVSEKEDPKRAAVIRKLQSLGKIPVSMFNKWRRIMPT